MSPNERRLAFLLVSLLLLLLLGLGLEYSLTVTAYIFKEGS